jgi:hypothetical protein
MLKSKSIVKDIGYRRQTLEQEQSIALEVVYRR